MSKRYKYYDKPISEQEGRNIRAHQLDRERTEIKHRKAQIAECQNKIRELQQEPYPTSVRVQVTLNPGDEGYDEAPPIFDPTEYQGNVMWQNPKSIMKTCPRCKSNTQIWVNQINGKLMCHRVGCYIIIRP